MYSIIKVERDLLSLLAFNQVLFYEAFETLKYQDFSLEIHQNIFKSLSELHQKDLVLTEEFLIKNISVDSSIIAEILLAENPKNKTKSIKYIKEASLKRKISNMLEKGEANIEFLIELIKKEMVIDKKIFRKLIDTSEMVEIFYNYLKCERINHRMKEDYEYITFDRNISYTQGTSNVSRRRNITPDNVITPIFDTILECLDQKKGVILFSLKMSALEVVQKLISLKENIPLNLIEDANLDDAQWSKLNNRLDQIKKLNFFIHEHNNSSTNMNILCSKIKSTLKNHKINIIIIDDISLFNETNLNTKLKECANNLDIKIIVVSRNNESFNNHLNTQKKVMTKNDDKLSQEICNNRSKLLIEMKMGSI